MKNLKIFFFIFIPISGHLWAQKNTQKGLEALSAQNFGLALNFFYKDLNKDSLSASFGLSNYYLNNYCFNADSAYLYINSCLASWDQANSKNKIAIQQRLPISDSSIFLLLQHLADKEFYFAKQKENIADLQQVILRYGREFEKIEQEAILIRDSIAFKDAANANTSQSFYNFISKYPASRQFVLAQDRYQKLLYSEQTSLGTELAFYNFIEKNQNSPFVDEAWQRIYVFYEDTNSVAQFQNFILRYPDAPEQLIVKAWEGIYRCYMQPFSSEKLAQFRIEFPNYPFSQKIKGDLELLSKKLYPFNLNGHFGYMDENGTKIIVAQYDDANPFIEDLAIVSNRELYGIINKKNDIILPFIYVDISRINKGFLLEDENGYYLLDSSLNFINSKPEQWEDIQQYLSTLNPSVEPEISNSAVFDLIEQNGKYGLNFNSKKIIEVKYDQILFESPLQIISVRQGQSLLYFDNTGKKLAINGMEWFLEAPELTLFNEDGIAVFFKAGKLGLINSKGKELIKSKYEMALPEYKGLWPVKFNGQWGVVDLSQKNILPFQYKSIVSFQPIGFLIEDNTGIGLIDSLGNWILTPSFKTIKSLDSNCLLVENEKGLGIYSSSGEQLVECAFNRIIPFDNDCLQLFSSEGLSYFVLSKRKYISFTP